MTTTNKLSIERAKEICISYLNEHGWDEMGKAHLAYWANHRENDAHYFSGSPVDSKCRWCSRTRTDVRWSDASPKCLNRPSWVNESIESVIVREEELFNRVIHKADVFVQKTNCENLTGADLSMLHHQEGIDPSMIECSLMKLNMKPLTKEQHEDYMLNYQKHKETGKRGGIKKCILVAK